MAYSGESAGEPGRLALLQESLHTLAAFVARADVGNALHRLGDERIVDLAAVDVGDQLLAGANRGGAGAGERLHEFVHLGIERVGTRNHLMHEADAVRLGGAEALDAKVDELLKALTGASPAAVRACKQLIADVAGREIDSALIAKTVEGIADIRASDEGREGVQAFLQKRKPSWLAG